MSYEAVCWALYDAPTLLLPSGKPDAIARFVLVARAERADAKGRDTYAGTADLIRATGLDERTIERAERRLEHAGLLIRAGISRLGTVLWHCDMSQKRADDNAAWAAAQIEKRRKADRERQQRSRERRKAGTENAPGIEGDVSPKIAVTDSASVTSGFEIRDVTDSASGCHGFNAPQTTLRTTQLNRPGTTPGGAPPPDPRRRPPPPASATDERNSPNGPLTPAQDQQRKSLPRESARGPDLPRLADVVDIESRRTA
jgi:hypothetical protein